METTKTPTADDINAHLRNGGSVLVSTYTRSTLYKAKHAGMFFTSASGELCVKHGKLHNRLTFSSGSRLLVSIYLQS